MAARVPQPVTSQVRGGAWPRAEGRRAIAVAAAVFSERACWARLLGRGQRARPANGRPGRGYLSDLHACSLTSSPHLPPRCVLSIPSPFVSPIGAPLLSSLCSSLQTRRLRQSFRALRLPASARKSRFTRHPRLAGLGAPIERFEEATFHATKVPSTPHDSARGQTGAPEAGVASCERLILLWDPKPALPLCQTRPPSPPPPVQRLLLSCLYRPWPPSAVLSARERRA